MPGHNVGKSEGPDPDPLPWLAVSEELKAKLMTKPYDAKKSCWVPDKSTGGYLEGLIQSKDGDKVTVKLIDRDEVGFACNYRRLPIFMIGNDRISCCGYVKNTEK